MIIITCILLLVNFINALPHRQYILELSTPASEFDYDHVKVRYVYESVLFNGVSVEFESNENPSQFIQQHSEIIKAWPIQHFSQQAPIKKKNDRYNSFFIPQSQNTLYELTKANYAYKDLNLDGSSIKVGIIDSGVDYTHPALGGCFGKGCKVAYGYDLVGNNFDGTMASIQSSHDPIDNCPLNSTSATGHGTFLSGLIAAEDKEYNWTGVAPGVTLGMWKVYGCNYGLVPNDILMKAMEMAYQAGMDIINLSLGIHGGWEEEALANMANRIVAKGVHVVAANGNIGPNGIFLSASPASGKDVIAVGSIMNEHVPGYILKVFSNETLSIPYRTFTNTPLELNEKLPILSSSSVFNKKDDLCTSPIHEKKSKNNTILLVHRCECDPIKQVEHAQQMGANAVIFYTDTTNSTTDVDVLSTAVLPIVFINNANGYRIFSALSHKPQAQFTNALVAMNAPESDILHTVSGFSSQGPTNELQLKPEIVGVGGNVFSTLPNYLKSYGFRSGTSMAAPFVSGQIALLLEKKRLKPDEVKSLLMNFATQVMPPTSASQYGDSPIRQGAGVINVTQAIHGLDLFHASPAYLGLNDTTHFIQQHQLTFYNNDQHSSLTLHLTHQPSLTAIGYADDYTPLEPVGLFGGVNAVSSIRFSKTSFIIPPGESTQVTLHFQPPPASKPMQHAIYGGYITATGKSTHVSIPYLGMVGNMKDLPILDHCNSSSPLGYPFPAIGLPNNNATLPKDRLGHFVIDQGGNGGPFVLARLLTGTRLLLIQVVKDHKVLGDMPLGEGLPRTWLMRNTLESTEYSNGFYSWQWHGNYVPKDVTVSGTNGGFKPKRVKSGAYQLKIKALKVFGDTSKDNDWDVWMSPKFMLYIK